MTSFLNPAAACWVILEIWEYVIPEAWAGSMKEIPSAVALAKHEAGIPLKHWEVRPAYEAGVRYPRKLVERPEQTEEKLSICVAVKPAIPDWDKLFTKLDVSVATTAAGMTAT
jgi:hypothetical protein